MPVISIAEDKWKDAEFTANFDDENFGFLGGFQEIMPDSLKKKKVKKEEKNPEKPKKTEAKKPEEDGEKVEKKKKKKKTKKRKKEKIVEEGDVQEDEGEPETKKKKKTEKEEKQLEESKKTKLEESKKTKAVKKKGKTLEKRAANVDKKTETVDKKKKAAFKGKDEEESAEDAEDQETGDQEVDFSAWDRFHLHETILTALKELKFSTPTPIQDAVLIPAVRDRLDILGTAETGSGKTVAFAIPVISRLLGEERIGNGPRALILAPTRELAVQILKTFNVFAKAAGFKVISIVGGLAEEKQIRVMKKQKPEILVATPGRLWDLMKQAEESSYLTDFTGLQCVVIDETDRMVEHGHFKELAQILDNVKSASQISGVDKLQTLVFSATLTYVVPTEKTARPGQEAKQKTLSTQEKTKLIIESTGMRPQKHKVIDLTREFGTAEKLVETRFNCAGLLDKDTNLVYLLKRYSGRTLIFTNSVDASRRLYGILTLLNFTPLMLHANMIQRQRLRNLERFTEQPNSILLATDVAARGLDIKGIEHVIHYQVPKTAEMYIHRSGRTARASETGLTVLMVDPKDAHLYRKLCRNLNREDDLPVFPVDSEELMNALHHRVKLASDLDLLSYRAKKIKLNETWFEKMAREADLDIDDRDKEREKSNDEYNDYLRKQDRVRFELLAELKHSLPELNRQQHPKTRFITRKFEISSHALDNLQTQLDEAKDAKKRSRKALKTRDIKGKQFKKKN